ITGTSALSRVLAAGQRPDNHRPRGEPRSRMKAVSGLYWVETFIQDVRYGVRHIGRSRLHAAAVVLTLALGIGLNTGVFSVLDGMLFRPRVTKDPATFVHLA